MFFPLIVKLLLQPCSLLTDSRLDLVPTFSLHLLLGLSQYRLKVHLKRVLNLVDLLLFELLFVSIHLRLELRFKLVIQLIFFLSGCDGKSAILVWLRQDLILSTCEHQLHGLWLLDTVRMRFSEMAHVLIRGELHV